MAKELAEGARTAGARFGFITCTVGVDVTGLRRALAEALPGVPFVGVTSCRSVIGAGELVRGPTAAAAWWLCGEVKAGVVAQSISAGDEAVGRQLAKQAAQALGGGRTASFALFHATPGLEEPLLRGVAQELKGTTPLLGGSAADDAIAGGWSVFTHEHRFTSGAALALVEWPGKVMAPFVSGAMPTEHRGVVTRAEGRTILELDRQPAADTYNRWLGGALDQAMVTGGNILNLTSLSPLGVMRPGGITLVHPERVVLPSRGLATFAEVKVGETVALVRSTKVGLQGRPSNLLLRAIADAGVSAADLKGVLLVYCAGCMLAIDPATESMVQGLRSVAGGAAIAGGFHFGEQGCASPGKPEHGNLMTGALLLA
jgi:hypothetical protein